MAKQVTLLSSKIMYWVEDLPKDMPILLQHGDEDDRVDVSNTLHLAKKLVELGRPHKVTIFEGENHVLSDKSEAYKEILNWFKSSPSNLD